MEHWWFQEDLTGLRVSGGRVVMPTQVSVTETVSFSYSSFFV